jgi:hypothetical protein
MMRDRWRVESRRHSVLVVGRKIKFLLWSFYSFLFVTLFSQFIRHCVQFMCCDQTPSGIKDNAGRIICSVFSQTKQANSVHLFLLNL